MASISEFLCRHCNAPNPPGTTHCLACGNSSSETRPSNLVAPLTGRDPILTDLLKQLSDVRVEGRGRFVLLEGEAGIGKSRLSRELLARLWGGEQWVLVARAYADRQGESYWLLKEALAHLFEFEPTMDRAGRRQRLLTVATELFGEGVVERTVPPLLWVLDLAEEGEQQEMERLVPEKRQQRLFRAIQSLLVVAGSKKPIVMLVDDAQWADEVSTAALIELLNKRAMLPLFVVAFSRPLYKEEVAPFVRLLADTPANVRYALEPLDDEESRNLLARLLGWTTVPAALDRLVLSRAQGTPFLIEELTRSLIERGVIFLEEGEWHFDHRRTHTALLLPRTVRGTVVERLDRLPQSARVLLELAALIGTRLELAVLMGAARRLPAQWRSRELEESVALLIERGFILRESPDTLRFRHNLVQETVVHDLQETQLTEYHLLIGQTIEQIYQPHLSLVIDRLARHFSQSSDAQRALEYSMRAGLTAVDRSAAEQARRFFRAALDRFPNQVNAHSDLLLAYGDLLNTGGHYEEAREIYMRALPQADPTTAARLHLKIGVTYSRRAEYEQAKEHFGKAYRALPGNEEKEIKVTLFSEIGWMYFQQGNLDEAENFYEKGLALLDYQDYRLQADLLNRLSGVLYRRQDLARAHKILLRAMDAHAEVGDLLGMAKTHNNLGTIYTEWGDYENGIEQRHQAMQIFERIGDREGLGTVLVNLAFLHATLGQFDQSGEYGRRCLELARETGQRYLECGALYVLGWGAINEGALSEGIAMLEESLSLGAEIKADDFYQLSQLRLAELQLAESPPPEGERLVQELFKQQQSASSNLLADIWRLQAAVSRRGGRLDEADRSIQSSLELVDPQQEPFLYLLCEMEYADLLVDKGNRPAAAERQKQALLRWHQIVQSNTRLPRSIESRLLS